MMTKADKTGQKKGDLTPAQSAAVDHLATGSSVTDAAKAANVTRQTVSGWLNHDPNFQAALNRRRAELWAETGDRLRALMPRALERIEKAITEGGPDGLTAALALVRMAKIDLTPAGGTDREEIEIEEAERESKLRMRRFSAAII